MKKELSEQIINKCLMLDSLLNTIKKSLMADGQDIDGFSDHYSDLLQQAIDRDQAGHSG